MLIEDDSREVPVGEAARIAGVSSPTLRRYADAGRIPVARRLLVRGDRRFTIAAAKRLRDELQADRARR